MWAQRQSKAIHQHSHMCSPWCLWLVYSMLFITSISPNCCSGTCANTVVHIFNINLASTLNLDLHALVCSLISLKTYTQTYLSARHFHSVLAAIQSVAEKCRWRIPRKCGERRWFELYAWTNRGVGRITCHRYERHIRYDTV